MKNMDKKDWLFIITLLIFILLFKYCKSDPKPIINTDIKDTIAIDNSALNVALANNKDLRIVNDSLVKLNKSYKPKYKAFYDTLIIQAPDTCHYYLSQLNRKCNVLDSINEQTISSYAEVLQSDLQVFAKYDKLNNSRIKQSKQDSLVIDSLTRSKKKYFKGVKHGIIIGAIITQGLNIGSQFIK